MLSRTHLGREFLVAIVAVFSLEVLQTETFDEVVAFLDLFDLSALAATNELCSSLAIKASARIRWEEFRDFRLFIET